MGVVGDMPKHGAAKGSWGLSNLIRRKQIDSINVAREGGHQLAKKLSLIDLIAIGVGTTIGAGVYILVGTVAREQTGPALSISFLIAGIAAALTSLCYAELASRCPSAGSAYHCTYICLGEGAAWLIGWALILEYTIGGSAVARGLTPNLALFFGGQDKLPFFLARYSISGLGVMVDPSAAVLVLVVTFLLCIGIKESALAQTIVTIVIVCGMLFIIIAGGYLAFKTGWVGYEVPRYFPFGINGILAGSGMVFFSYIGFDVVASTAEEAKNPQRDMPFGIGISLLICCILYLLVSVVIVGLVPYYALDLDTPISSAFASHGMQWAVYAIATGTVTALFASLMGSLLPQPRLFMAMARDGLLPSFFSDIDTHTHVPVKSTVIIGILVAALATFMEVSQLAGMVSVGTLLAFTAVAISVLVLRYIPPDEVPLLSSCQDLADSLPLQFSDDIQASPNSKGIVNYCDHNHHLLDDGATSATRPLLEKYLSQDQQIQHKRRKIATWSITLVCAGALVLASSASFEKLPSILCFTFSAVGGALSLCSLVVLACISQDNSRHSFGHTGGFVCPFVPYLPVASILVNTYLLVNLGAGTWIRVSTWLLIGALIYLFYGWTHSSLRNAVYVPRTRATEICHTSSHHAH